MTTTASALPMLLEELEVTAVERLSPSFVRVEFGRRRPGRLRGRRRPLFDQRIKLVFPDGGGPLPVVRGRRRVVVGHLDRAAGRGARPHAHLHRARRASARARTPGWSSTSSSTGTASTGPAVTWGARAQVGDRLVALAPRRGLPFGGIEFEPGDGDHLLLVGDETAVPAIARSSSSCRARPGARRSSRCRSPTTSRTSGTPRA